MYWPIVIVTACLLLVYCLLILQYRKWFLQLPLFTMDPAWRGQTKFSIIIPARDEEENIRKCLGSVLHQNYPSHLFEVIVINDHSTDRTEDIIRSMQAQHANLRLLNLSELIDTTALNAYKKKAIEIAIAHSNGEWIITTDADCTVQNNWLLLYDAFIRQKGCVFVAAPVMFTNDHSFLSVFQLLDFISLQGITAASVSAGYHTMCNGANIAYKKDVFYEVGQFADIDHLASGDDMLLMHKIKQRYPQQLGYLFCERSIVTTPSMPNWKSFLNQRIRWASKADKYNDKSIFWVLALVYAVNAGMLILLCWSPFITNGWYNWLILLVAKTIVELGFMIPVARFYGHSSSLWYFPLMQPFHILYTVIAGWLGKFGSYRWKGRKVR